MTGTVIRLSASGRRGNELKRYIGENLKRLGFTSHRYHTYKHIDDIEGRKAASIITMAYAVEAKLTECSLVSFVISGRLSNATLRQNANRAI